MSLHPRGGNPIGPMFDPLANSPAAPQSGALNVPALLGRFGSPLFIVSEAALRHGYRAFRGAFAGLRPRIAYSYKTNYLPALCAILHQEGAGAEVVSGMEYALARSLGVAPNDIVFNGPGKTRGELSAALRDGALVVVDGLGELEAAIAIADEPGFGPQRRARIGLRADLGKISAPWSRFGLRDMRRAFERIAGKPVLSFELLHHHAGTDHRDPEPYRAAVRGLLGLKREAAEFGLRPGAIDLGGGFPAALPLAPFAEAIAEALAESGGEAPALVLEPGRALVDTAVRLACTVVAAKEMASGPAVVIDAGINFLPQMCRSAPRPLAPAGPAPGVRVPTAVFGPLCMPEDRLAENILLPPLRPGDPLIVYEAGAYTLSQATEFTAPRPAVVLIGPDGPEIIRRREDWRDVMAPCELPARLSPADSEWRPETRNRR